MEKKLELLRDQFFESERQFKEESLRPDNLRKRISSTQIKLNSKDREIEGVKEAYKITLTQDGRSEDEESNESVGFTDKISQLGKEREALENLLDTLKKMLPESEKTVLKLSEAYMGARHALWFAISEHEASKLKEVEGPLIRSWSAFLLAGCPPNLGPFLQSRFANFKWDLTKVEAELKKEYLSTPPQKGGK